MEVPGLVRRLRVPCRCMHGHTIRNRWLTATQAWPWRPHRIARQPTAVAVAVFTLVGGCVGPVAVNANRPLLVSTRPYEADVPLPAGFRLVDRSSEDWSGGKRIRYLRHRYQGRADKYSVRQFYRQQMPLVRWTAISDGNVNGRITMRFERGAESCTITIEDEKPRISRRVAVEVIIAPVVR